MKKVLALVIALSLVSMNVFAEGVGEQKDCACDKVSSATVKDSNDSSTKSVQSGSNSTGR